MESHYPFAMILGVLDDKIYASLTKERRKLDEMLNQR
jgi:hypothetical protein